MHCISRGMRAVGERGRNKQGCGGPRLGRSHGRSQYLNAGCQNPVTAAGCPATGTRTGSLLSPTGTRGKKNAGGKPGQPLNLGSTGCIYIRPDRMFPLHGSPGGSLISARLQKVSWPCFSPSLFCFSRVPSVPFHSPLFPHLSPFPLLGGRGYRLIQISHKCSDPEHPRRTTPAGFPLLGG